MKKMGQFYDYQYAVLNNHVALNMPYPFMYHNKRDMISENEKEGLITVHTNNSCCSILSWNRNLDKINASQCLTYILFNHIFWQQRWVEKFLVARSFVSGRWVRASQRLRGINTIVLKIKCVMQQAFVRRLVLSILIFHWILISILLAWSLLTVVLLFYCTSCKSFRFFDWSHIQICNKLMSPFPSFFKPIILTSQTHAK